MKKGFFILLLLLPIIAVIGLVQIKPTSHSNQSPATLVAADAQQYATASEQSNAANAPAAEKVLHDDCRDHRFETAPFERLLTRSTVEMNQYLADALKADRCLQLALFPEQEFIESLLSITPSADHESMQAAERQIFAQLTQQELSKIALVNPETVFAVLPSFDQTQQQATASLLRILALVRRAEPTTNSPFAQLPKPHNLITRIENYLNASNSLPDFHLWLILGEYGNYDGVAEIMRPLLVDHFLSGDTTVLPYLTTAQWLQDIYPHELSSAFLKTEPHDNSVDMSFIAQVVAHKSPSTYTHLAAFIEQNPQRYAIYQLLKRNPAIDLSLSLDRLEDKLALLPTNEQLDAALILASHGSVTGLKFILAATESYSAIDPQRNVRKLALRLINEHEVTESKEAWALEHIDELVFDVNAKRFSL